MKLPVAILAISIAFTASSVFTAPSFAGEPHEAGLQRAISATKLPALGEKSETSPVIPIQHHGDHHRDWRFVGCVPSHDACSHHAHQHGYRQHRVTDDRGRCHHHPHLACWGR